MPCVDDVQRGASRVDLGSPAVGGYRGRLVRARAPPRRSFNCIIGDFNKSSIISLAVDMGDYPLLHCILIVRCGGPPATPMTRSHAVVELE